MNSLQTSVIGEICFLPLLMRLALIASPILLTISVFMLLINLFHSSPTLWNFSISDRIILILKSFCWSKWLSHGLLALLHSTSNLLSSSSNMASPKWGNRWASIAPSPSGVLIWRLEQIKEPKGPIHTRSWILSKSFKDLCPPLALLLNSKLCS